MKKFEVLNQELVVITNKLKDAKKVLKVLTDTKAKNVKIESAKSTVERYEQQRDAKKTEISELKKTEKEILKALKNESFTEYRGLLATFNAIKKTLKEKKIRNSRLLTNKFHAKNVLAMIDYNRLVMIQKSGLNYGQKNHFNTLFDAVLNYLDLAPALMVKVDAISEKINALLMENKDTTNLDFFANLRKIQPTETINKTVAKYIYLTNVAQFDTWNLIGVYNHQEETRKAADKKLEKAIELVNEHKATKKVATLDVVNA